MLVQRLACRHLYVYQSAVVAHKLGKGEPTHHRVHVLVRLDDALHQHRFGAIVLEEFLLERSSIEPLEVVGWEGMFGFAVTLIVMLVLHFTVGVTDQGRYGMFDMVEGFRQMTQNNEVWVSSLLIMLSIGYVIYPQSPLTPFSLYRPTANQKKTRRAEASTSSCSQ